MAEAGAVRMAAEAVAAVRAAAVIGAGSGLD